MDTTAPSSGPLRNQEAHEHTCTSPVRTTGLLRCGICGNKLFSAIRVDTRRYVCLCGPDHGGCGGIAIVAAPLEEFLAAGVLMRLDTTEMSETMKGRRAADDRQSTLLESLEEERSQMKELSELWAAKEISSAEWKAARGPIEARIKATERQLAQASKSTALDGLIDRRSAERAMGNAEP